MPAKEIHPAYRDTLLLDFAAQMAWQAGDLPAVVAACLDQMAWDGGLSGRRAFGSGMAVMALAEMGRHEEAASIQRSAEGTYRGRSWWVLSRLTDWSGAVAVALAGDEREAMRRLAGTAEDATAHGYWAWGRWMIVDLAEAAAHAADATLARRAEALLRADPWPPSGSSHDGARALVEGSGAVVAGPGAAATDALDRLDEAVEAFRSAGWPLLEGRALALLGAALGRRDRSRAARDPRGRGRPLRWMRGRRAPQEVLAALAALGSKGRRKKAELVGPGVADRP